MYIAKQSSTLNRILNFLLFQIHLMCSGGVSVIILGVAIDAAVQPVITLFDGSNSTRSGVSVTLRLQLALYIQPKYYSSLLVSYPLNRLAQSSLPLPSHVGCPPYLMMWEWVSSTTSLSPLINTSSTVTLSRH